MQGGAETEGRGLLRLLFIWLEEVPADAGTVWVLLLADKRLCLFRMTTSPKHRNNQSKSACPLQTESHTGRFRKIQIDQASTYAVEKLHGGAIAK